MLRKYREIILVILCIGIGIGSFGQNGESANGEEHESSRVRKLLNQANEAFYYENYRRALKLFHRLDSLDSTGTSFYMYQIGLCYLFSQIENEKSIEYMQSSIKAVSSADDRDYVYFNLGRAYHMNNRFEEAIKAFNKAEYLSFNEELIKRIRLFKKVSESGLKLVKHPSNAIVSNSGLDVNSSFPDYKPVVSADESTLIFTSRKAGSTGQEMDLTGRYYEDIYICKRDELGNWSAPTHISPNIDSDLDEASVGLSADGKKLFIYKGRENGGEIFESNFDGKEWSKPSSLGRQVNSKFWETSASISADGQSIYFISDRKGTNGGRDIYVSQKKKDKWGKPKNLGKTINSEEDEESPFIHPDGKTLYFSSMGHNAIGGFDIFKSTLENGEWSAPENLGFPINSATDDAHFVLIASGKRGYFSSGKTGGLGEQDIYTVEFPDAIVPLVLIRGMIEKDGDAPVTMKVINTSNKDQVNQVYQPNPEGDYLLILHPGSQYTLLVEQKGSAPYAFDLDLRELTTFKEILQNISLKEGNISIANKIKESFKENKDVGSNERYLKILTEQLFEAKSDGMDKVAANIFNITKKEAVATKKDSVPNTILAFNDGAGELKTIETPDGPIKVRQLATVKTLDRTIVYEPYLKEKRELLAKGTIYFPSNSFLLDQNSKNELNEVFHAYLQNKHQYIKIVGYTDQKGTDEYNYKLSKRRTNTIEKYFIALGVPKSFILTIPRGEVKSNASGEERFNRRAEFFILKK